MSEGNLVERTERFTVQDYPSMKEWVVSILYERGMHTLDDLGAWIPEANWTRLCLAVDSLSRDGTIELRRSGQGGYALYLRDRMASRKCERVSPSVAPPPFPVPTLERDL